ncbi:DMT family transporter [Mycetocola zhujimingii]|uniref:Multidrug DMT transporter permease n=1 Tax=Mycetocola zhujimingii TaxID=2079792 RepID=A0A2U1TGW2_9MICO|nr:DMT family transporter [Mycetocola zhujimingii]AWB86585.1 multidrug DMT transporter permease [Mycetocola zhujimingii]PWC08127.1 multidrug DMT transporter permease [Mycetocola zhujimingii]
MFANNDFSDLTSEFVRNPSQLIGIPLAIVGAVFMSLGAQFQHRGVTKVESSSGVDATTGLNFSQLKLLLTRPSWVLGTLMLGFAIAFQLSALAFSPLILVQPLGAIALVITAILNARIYKMSLNRPSVIAISACVAGVALFVTIAALVGGEKPVSNVDLITILIMLGVVLILLTLGFLFFRKRAKALFYILAAGIIYGFVATLAKVVINRIVNENFDWLTVLCVVGLLVAAGLGAYFVQTAYSSGPPDLVIAGLTVVDPMVAVAIGIVVLDEASGAPLWAVIGFAVAGAIAVWGVFQLARHHPQVQA